jgi:hypothetical protein
MLLHKEGKNDIHKQQQQKESGGGYQRLQVDMRHNDAPWITPTNSIPPQKGLTTDHLSPDTGEAAERGL